MKQDSLEALLIDRVLGELSPEVAELLDEHLGSDPMAARQSKEWESTCEAARQVATVPVDPLPACVPAGSRRRWLLDHRSELLRLAACLVLGAALGWSASSVQQGGAGTGTLADSTPRVRPSESGPRFWSVRNLVQHDPGLARVQGRLEPHRIGIQAEERP